MLTLEANGLSEKTFRWWCRLCNVPGVGAAGASGREGNARWPGWPWPARYDRTSGPAWTACEYSCEDSIFCLQTFDSLSFGPQHSNLHFAGSARSVSFSVSRRHFWAWISSSPEMIKNCEQNIDTSVNQWVFVCHTHVGPFYFFVLLTETHLLCRVNLEYWKAAVAKGWVTFHQSTQSFAPRKTIFVGNWKPIFSSITRRTVQAWIFRTFLISFCGFIRKFVAWCFQIPGPPGAPGSMVSCTSMHRSEIVDWFSSFRCHLTQAVDHVVSIFIFCFFVVFMNRKPYLPSFVVILSVSFHYCRLFDWFPTRIFLAWVVVRDWAFVVLHVCSWDFSVFTMVLQWVLMAHRRVYCSNNPVSVRKTLSFFKIWRQSVLEHCRDPWACKDRQA